VKQEFPPIGSHVTLDYDGRHLLGEVVGFVVDPVVGRLLQVRHFNGEPWPLMPCAAAVQVLEREPFDDG